MCLRHASIFLRFFFLGGYTTNVLHAFHHRQGFGALFVKPGITSYVVQRSNVCIARTANCGRRTGNSSQLECVIPSWKKYDIEYTRCHIAYFVCVTACLHILACLCRCHHCALLLLLRLRVRVTARGSGMWVSSRGVLPQSPQQGAPGTCPPVHVRAWFQGRTGRPAGPLGWVDEKSVASGHADHAYLLHSITHRFISLNHQFEQHAHNCTISLWENTPGN